MRALLLITVYLAFSCDKKDSLIEHNLREVIISVNSTHKFDSLKAVVIIPEGGCAGCIERAMDFLRGHDNYYKKVLFIITGVSDKKLTRLKLTEYNLAPSQNLIIDFRNEVIDKGLLSVYPQIFYLKLGVVESIDTSNPENSEIWINFIKRMSDKLN